MSSALPQESTPATLRQSISRKSFPVRLPFEDRYKERIPLVQAFGYAVASWKARQRVRELVLDNLRARLRLPRRCFMAAECGVYKGHALVACMQLARDLGTPARIFGLDTFAGLPELSSMDRDLAPPEAPYRRKTLFADSSLQEVEALCRANRIEDSVVLVPGLFSDTLPTLPEQRYNFVNIDCDLYEPHLQCLEYFYPRMEKGGVMFFDDYHSAEYPMARKAIDEFMADRPEQIFHLRYGEDEPNHTKCFIVRF